MVYTLPVRSRSTTKSDIKCDERNWKFARLPDLLLNLCRYGRLGCVLPGKEWW